MSPIVNHKLLVISPYVLALLVFFALMGVLDGHSQRSNSAPSPHTTLQRTPDIVAGRSTVKLRLANSNSPGGGVGPGARIDIVASVWFRKNGEAIPLVVDVPILEMNRDQTYTVSVDQTQALLIELALLRKCDLTVYLRGPEGEGEFDKYYDSEAVIRYLANKGRWSIPGRAEEEMPVPRSAAR